MNCSRPFNINKSSWIYDSHSDDCEKYGLLGSIQGESDVSEEHIAFIFRPRSEPSKTPAGASSKFISSLVSPAFSLTLRLWK
jgi:hypothetical protein